MKYPEIDDVNHEEMSDIEYEFLTPKEVMNLLCVGKTRFTVWSTLANCPHSGSENYGVLSVMF